MMDLLLATSGGESQFASGGYVDDVFSAYTYTGNGATQTINNGIDLAGKGGLVWTKQRNGANAAYASNILIDTVRGRDYKLHAEDTTPNSEILPSHLFESFNTTGYTVSNYGYLNSSNNGFVSWTFRKAPKFFDVVTYTGNGVAGRQIPHSLGVAPGMIVVKRTNGSSAWYVQHRSVVATGILQLDKNDQINTDSSFGNTYSTSSHFTVDSNLNTNTYTYVAYLFAHDPAPDGIIQCGSFATDGSGNATANLGWESQFSMVKAISTTSDWIMLDSMRGWNMSANDATLLANTSGAETVATERGNPTATGFDFKGGAASQTYIYLAIRRPNKPPTSGTEVYNAIARTGASAAATVTGVGFAPDLSITKKRSSTTLTGARFIDRLRGATRWLDSSATTAETATTDTVTGLDSMSGIVLGADATTSAFNTSGHTYINHFFRRAKGVFDIVCDTGTGVAHGVNHGLSAAPEFVIRKSRSGATQWECWHSALAATEKMVLNSTAAKVTDATAWNSTLPTSTQFTVGTGANVNTNAATYVTYLFATLAGISKVGSYTGNGTSQTINCGFATGARFILVKRTDATGDWYVWDSVRGIVAANDPHLSLNTTAAEVTTDDSVDPDASGFIVNQNTTTNINVNGGQYIFLAIA